MHSRYKKALIATLTAYRHLAFPRKRLKARLTKSYPPYKEVRPCAPPKQKQRWRPLLNVCPLAQVNICS